MGGRTLVDLRAVNVRYSCFQELLKACSWDERSPHSGVSVHYYTVLYTQHRFRYRFAAVSEERCPCSRVLILYVWVDQRDRAEIAPMSLYVVSATPLSQLRVQPQRVDSPARSGRGIETAISA